MTPAEESVLIHRAIQGLEKVEDYEPFTRARYLVEWFSPSRRDEPTAQPESVVERVLQSKPERLKAWLEKNADPETILRTEGPDLYAEYMLARLDQQAKLDAEARAAREKNLKDLERARAVNEARRTERRMKKEAES